jgi:hypothetical protein
MPDADGKIVWSCPPDAGVKPCEDVSQGDGGNKARFTGESTYKPLKPIAQGRPDCFGGPVVATRVLSTFAHEAAGAQNTRSSLRPLFLPRDVPKQNPGKSCRGNAEVYPVIARSEATKQSRLHLRRQSGLLRFRSQ